MLTRSKLVGVVYDPEQWHYRAQQMRLLATATTDPVAKSMMLLIGDGFEALSERAAERKRLFPKELSLRPHGVGTTTGHGVREAAVWPECAPHSPNDNQI